MPNPVFSLALNSVQDLGMLLVHLQSRVPLPPAVTYSQDPSVMLRESLLDTLMPVLSACRRLKPLGRFRALVDPEVWLSQKPVKEFPKICLRLSKAELDTLRRLYDRNYRCLERLVPKKPTGLFGRMPYRAALQNAMRNRLYALKAT